MASNRTLAIIKPDAIASGKAGLIIAHLQKAGFVIRGSPPGAPVRGRGRGLLCRALRTTVLSRAGRLHDRAGPACRSPWSGTDAVATLRSVIGATDPAEAAAGTIRKLYAESKGKNAIHASDSDENAAREIGFFFTEGELAGLWG